MPPKGYKNPLGGWVSALPEDLFSPFTPEASGYERQVLRIFEIPIIQATKMSRKGKTGLLGRKNGEKYQLLEGQQVGSKVSLPFLQAEFPPHIFSMSLNRPGG